MISMQGALAVHVTMALAEFDDDGPASGGTLALKCVLSFSWLKFHGSAQVWPKRCPSKLREIFSRTRSFPCPSHSNRWLRVR